MKTVIPIKQVAADKYGKDADGWEKMSTLSEPRLSEMAENYRAIGFEIEVREVQRSEGECNVCFDEDNIGSQVFGTIFVRRKGIASQDKDSSNRGA